MAGPRVGTYLTFDGNCREAFEFYERVLGAKRVMLMTFGESPMADETPPSDRSKVMHVAARLGDGELFGSDASAGMPYQKPAGVSLSLNYETLEEARRIFAALGQGGKVCTAMAKTFWTEGFGSLVDRFGIAWLVSVADKKQ